MGFALADALAGEGAVVTLVSGPSAFFAASNAVTVHKVQTASEMFEACKKVFPDCDGAILAAAVADFRPKHRQAQKIKKEANNGKYYLELEPTPDILAYLGTTKRPGQVLVGFSLETHDGPANALTKLRNKNLDLVVLNELETDRTVFGDQSVGFQLIDKQEAIKAFPAQSKPEMAKTILEQLKGMAIPV